MVRCLLHDSRNDPSMQILTRILGMVLMVRLNRPGREASAISVQRTFQALPGDAIRSGLRYPIKMELIFEVRDAEEGGYCARALGYPIFTEAETWEELRANVLEATSLHFEDSPHHPRLVQLHYTKDELIPVEVA